MTLQLRVTLPEVREKREKFGGNFVNKIIFPATEVKLDLLSEKNGNYKFKSPLPHPLDIIYISTSARVKTENVDYQLTSTDGVDIKNINNKTKLKWKSFPQMGLKDNPLDEWSGKFKFIKEDKKSNTPGLRRPQIGAIHAVSAYIYGDEKYEPITVVLPTGTGKTETMLSLFFYHAINRLLIIVPTNALRKQLSEKFITMGCLPEFGITPTLMKYPKVAVITKGLLSGEAQKILDNSNVIIATPNILKSSNHIEAEILCGMCGALFVDEAHHISANTWSSVRDRFKNKPVVQFTATPFRNDGKNLGGKITFNYTMGAAQRDGYFKKIELCTISEFLDSDKDEKIAIKAIELLRRDLKHGHDHLIMARVNTKERAKEIYSIYANLAAEYNPIIVHSALSDNTIKERLDFLINRKSRLVVCVDMLGEGFDLPNLKIAAIHDHHKSLAVTLQFIGRFTRTSRNSSVSNASVVVNIADPGVEKELLNLYSQGSNWDQVLRRLSEERISKEIKLQDLVDSLKSHGDLHTQISLWNLRPSFSVMLFSTKSEEWNPLNLLSKLPKLEASYYSLSQDSDIIMVLGVRSSAVKWGNFKDVNDLNHLLLVAYFNKDLGSISLFSNDYSYFRAESIAECLVDVPPTPVTGSKVFQVLNNVEYPLVLNLGSATNGAISFTQFFGPNVAEGLSDVEKRNSTLSNIAIMGYEDGNKTLWGCSQKKGKVWSPKAGSILDWIDWVDSTWKKINEDDADENNLTQDFLRPKKMTSTYSEHPISAQWGELIQSKFEDSVTIHFGEKLVSLYDVDLKISKDEDDLLLHLVSETKESIYKLVINSSLYKGYDYELVKGDEINFTIGSATETSFNELMVKDPITIYYVNGSFSYNCYLINVNAEHDYYSKNSLNDLDWTVNIRNESMGRTSNKNTIQYETYNIIKPLYDVIINDDEHGEAADLVALKENDDHILLSLYHCKFSSEDTPGARLKELYEVCGQAQRSIRWKHVGLNYLFRHLKRREEQWNKANLTRFLVGNMSKIQYIRDLSKTKPIKFKVTIVQPGISKEKITSEMLRLLGATAVFIKKTTLADLNVWCSK